MFRFTKPDEPTIRTFLQSQSSLELTYSAIGSTGGTPPSGYVVDHARAKLGEGEAAFVRAQAALRNWSQFRLGWVEPFWPETPLEPGHTVAVLAHVFGLWSLNAARIVYVVQEQEPVRRFGFAYGTLPDHVESGEERFTVEWNQDDDSVWYDILAFSRPNHILARLGYSMTRRTQRRFAQGSLAAMKREVDPVGA